jgi:CheY-like chemotaxis protein
LAAALGRFWVSTATNGREALDLVAGTKFDVAVLDISMPGMNGIELAGAITGRNIRIAFHTSMPEAWLRTRTTDYHAFIGKPVNSDEFLLAVRKLCASAPLADE